MPPDVTAIGPGRGNDDAGFDGDLVGVGLDGNFGGLAGVGQPTWILCLPTIMAPRTDTRLITRRNPCRIKGANRENSPERPVLTVAQAYALADAVGLRFRALILLAAFTSLRWAELVALRPGDIDLDARTVRVTRQIYYHQAGYSYRSPKSRAGVRVVAFPELIAPDVRKHLEWLSSSALLVFASSTGSPLAHSNFRRPSGFPPWSAPA